MLLQVNRRAGRASPRVEDGDADQTLWDGAWGCGEAVLREVVLGEAEGQLPGALDVRELMDWGCGDGQRMDSIASGIECRKLLELGLCARARWGARGGWGSGEPWGVVWVVVSAVAVSALCGARISAGKKTLLAEACIGSRELISRTASRPASTLNTQHIHHYTTAVRPDYVVSQRSLAITRAHK